MAIKLVVEEYCQNCMRFTPVTDVMQHRDFTDTTVYCKSNDICNRQMVYLINEMKWRKKEEEEHK